MSRSEFTYGHVHAGVDGVDGLIELALDLRSEWNHSTDVLWRRLDPELWEATRNPGVVLQTVSRRRLEEVLGDAEFREDLERLLTVRRDGAEAPAWFQKRHASSALRGVAYFSLEFMLSEALPIYSGGLGNVAGDQLKAANDLGVPVTGVGLLYQQGYFRQVIDSTGAQQVFYPYNEPGQLPITPLREATGEWLRIKLELPGHNIWIRAWEARIGRLRLYLLDTNDFANHPPYRAITSELYGGGPELRLMQEIVLGIGGWRLLRALDAEPEVCHLNEGHAALVVLERARCFMVDTGQPFHAALAATRAGNLFTTHTAVPAGFDSFTASQMSHCLRGYVENDLGVPFDDVLALGRSDAANSKQKFNMAYLAIRGSAAVNAVSRLHGEVSRQLFAPLFPRWPLRQVPIDYVTNGVHMPTWDSAAADALWTEACGKRRWLDEIESLEHDICCVSDEVLWQFRGRASSAFITYARDRLARQARAAGADAGSIDVLTRVLSPKVLTLGFARRFATYKRPNLLLRDPDRLLRLLNHAERPMQIVLAGKAHPADAAGQALIREWVLFSRRPEAAGQVVFLSDYDMRLAEQLVQGVDLWLNTPRRPWEACGTSGMKVLVNGGINLSVLDGWWAEAYAPELGWALGDNEDEADDAVRDAADAELLYDLLEHEVVPEFYDRDAHNIPRAWVARMRNSMARLAPKFSTNRSMREYTERYYLPAAAAFRRRAAKDGELGARIANWRRGLDVRWHEVRFGAARIELVDEQYVFEIGVELGSVDPADVRVELYADGVAGLLPECRSMQQCGETSYGMLCYRAVAPRHSSPETFTARVVAYHVDASLPLEAGHILWQR